MKYLIIVKGTFEDTEHPYSNYKDAMQAYENFMTLYIHSRNVTLTLFCTEDGERMFMQQITF